MYIIRYVMAYVGRPKAIFGYGPMGKYNITQVPIIDIGQSEVCVHYRVICTMCIFDFNKNIHR